MDTQHHPQFDCPSSGLHAHFASCLDSAFSTPQGFGSIIDSLSIGVVVFDKCLQIVIANSQACRIIDPCGTVDKAIKLAIGDTDIEDWWKVLNQVIQTGRPAVFDAMDMSRSGKKIKVDIECTAIRDVKTADIIGGVIVLKDVTEKVEIERKLSQSERFAAIGKLAGKVAHELNNPLDGIIRYINLALRNVENAEDEKTVGYLKQSRQGLVRMTNIISELLEFSRSSYLTSQRVSVLQIVEEAVKTILPCAKNVAINIDDNNKQACSCLIDGNMFQVYCNIIKNAVDAMEGEGALDILIDTDDKFSIVSFSDSGPGFDEKLAEDIFKPFFTTKSPGSGTGLGLAICRDIVDKYGGNITAENIKDGCKFTVYTLHGSKFLRE